VNTGTRPGTRNNTVEALRIDAVLRLEAAEMAAAKKAARPAPAPMSSVRRMVSYVGPTRQPETMTPRQLRRFLKKQFRAQFLAATAKYQPIPRAVRETNLSRAPREA
jgi:hypothetical protein